MDKEKALAELTAIRNNIEKLPGVLKCKLNGNIARMIFGNYQCKVIFGKNDVGIFGRGSFLLARDVESFSDSNSQEYAIKVGNHCEIANGGKILLGGEHDNKLPINSTLSVFPYVELLANERKIKLHRSNSRGPVNIGNNVTISKNAIILSGVSIGNGAVIGAGAVVTKDVPDFAIVTGVPGQVNRYRFDEKIRESLNQIKWWDLTQEALIDNYQKIQKIPDSVAVKELMQLAPNKYYPTSNNYLVFHQAYGEHSSSFVFLGVEIDGKKIFAKDLPREVQYYMEQPKLPNTADTWYYLIEDIFTTFNLK